MRIKPLLSLLSLILPLALTGCGGPANLAFARGMYFEQRGNAHLRDEDPLTPEGIQEYRNAIEQYTAAIKLKARYLEAISHRATCYERIGDSQQAIADTNEAVALAPTDAGMWKERAWINREQGNWQQSEDDYQMALGIHKPDAVALAGAGAAQLELGEVKKARAALDQAVKEAPSNAGIWCERATLFRKLHEVDDMRKNFRAALALHPHDAELYQKYGYAEFILGNYSQATTHFQSAMNVSGWTYRGTPYTVILSVLGSRLSFDKDSAREWLAEGISHFDVPLATADGAADAKAAPRWPLPALQYLHGDITADKLLAAAGSDKDRLTEAHCYLGLQALAEGNKDVADKFLKQVVAQGNRNFVEYDVAVELLSAKNKSSVTHGSSPASDD